VARLTPRGVDLTLSHYCPTAAELPFAEAPDSDDGDPLLRIVTSPPAFPAERPYEGLDARAAFPPQLRPGVLMGWDDHERWEEHVVAVLGKERDPDRALDQLTRDAERIRTWTPEAGSLAVHLERELARSEPPHSSEGTAAGDPTENWEKVAATIPLGLRRLTAPRPIVNDERRPAFVKGGDTLALPIRRWLASKAFASWLPLQGEGVRTSIVGLRVARDVLQGEWLRSHAEGRLSERDRLKQAFRAADLLLVHLADPEALARVLSRCERSASSRGGRPVL